MCMQKVRHGSVANRIIKDTIRTSKKVNSMTDFQFRLWVYLITYVDDYGRGSADPELLKGFVFPRRKGITESNIKNTLAELACSGFILLYEVDGESYFCFPNWGEHQRIQTKKSKFPAPEDGVMHDSTVSHGESPSESNPIQSNPNTNPNTLSDESVTPARAKKIKHGDYKHVLLTDKELEMLRQEYGDGQTNAAIKFLDEYIEMKGYKAKNHNLVMRKWVFDAVAERERKNPKARQASFESSSFDPDEFFAVSMAHSFDDDIGAPPIAADDEGIRTGAEELRGKLGQA